MNVVLYHIRDNDNFNFVLKVFLNEILQKISCTTGQEMPT